MGPQAVDPPDQPANQCVSCHDQHRSLQYFSGMTRQDVCVFSATQIRKSRNGTE
jgi:hypothetical protein